MEYGIWVLSSFDISICVAVDDKANASRRRHIPENAIKKTEEQ